jgi:predicted nucleotidyltransferase
MRARGRGESALMLLDVVDVLSKERVDYAVIGAMAASVHGSIRATTDADALLSVTPARLRRIERALANSGFVTDFRRGGSDDPIPALLAVSDRYGNRVDLLAGLRGLDPDALSRALSVPFMGSTIRVIGREDFIAMKCFAGGPQHLVDARQAFATADGRLDVDLLRRATRRFGSAASDALEQLLRE